MRSDRAMTATGQTFQPHDHPSRQNWRKEDVLALARQVRTWGLWGPEDELGAANRVTADKITQAARLVRAGKVFSMSIPLDRGGPQHGKNTRRTNPQHVMLRSGSDIAAEGLHGMCATDDAVYMPLQAATQWDALCHVFYDGKTYNNRGPESVTSTGANRNSITNLRDRALGRGVLLDIARMKNRDHLDPGEAIQDHDLERCAQLQGVEVGEGDFLLVRTGHLEARRKAGIWGDYAAGPSPGLGISAANFLCQRQVTAIATDTWGMEVLPYESADVRCPLHVILLVNAGIYIGEIWDMEALAADCAHDGIYDFFLTAQPLTITGSVGSPINPLAIK